MNVRRAVWAVLLVAFAQIPRADSAWAQVSRLEEELEITEEIISRAAELARDAGNAQALELVHKAVEIQTAARISFRNGRYEMAATQTQMARSLAERALALVVRPEERVERVELELERTDQMLAGARDDWAGDLPEAARTLLAAAVRQQQQAWEYYRAGRLRPALQLTLQVREMLRKLHAQLSDFRPDEFRAEFERVRELVEQALREARESGVRRRMELSEQASEMLKRAREHAAHGRLRAAVRQLDSAEKLARQAHRQPERDVTREDFDAARAHYERRREELSVRLSETPVPEARRLLHESQEHYRLAVRLTGEGESELWRALAELRIALRLLHRAGELLP